MRLHVDASWILKEYFHKQRIDLFSRHLFKCCDSPLDSVEIVLILLNQVPIHADFLAKTCVFLLQIVDDPKLVGLHIFVLEGASLFRAIRVQEVVDAMLKIVSILTA